MSALIAAVVCLGTSFTGLPRIDDDGAPVPDARSEALAILTETSRQYRRHSCYEDSGKIRLFTCDFKTGKFGEKPDYVARFPVALRRPDSIRFDLNRDITYCATPRGVITYIQGRYTETGPSRETDFKKMVPPEIAESFQSLGCEYIITILTSMFAGDRPGEEILGLSGEEIEVDQKYEYSGKSYISIWFSGRKYKKYIMSKTENVLPNIRFLISENNKIIEYIMIDSPASVAVQTAIASGSQSLALMPACHAVWSSGSIETTDQPRVGIFEFRPEGDAMKVDRFEFERK